MQWKMWDESVFSLWDNTEETDLVIDFNILFLFTNIAIQFLTEAQQLLHQFYEIFNKWILDYFFVDCSRIEILSSIFAFLSFYLYFERMIFLFR